MKRLLLILISEYYHLNTRLNSFILAKFIYLDNLSFMASSRVTVVSSAASISDQSNTGTSLDFSLFFKVTYPDEDT
jgi:hypothetical protein